MFNKIKSAFSLWNIVRGTSSSAVLKQANLPLSLAIIGDATQFEQLSTRLQAPHVARRVAPGDAIIDEDGLIVLDARKLLPLSAADFISALSKIAIRHAERRIALAANVPAFRSAVVSQISHERALENAKFAALSALPGVIPLTDWLLPATSASDMYVLTKNQIMLVLEVAACYGRPPDAVARIKELLPVIGGAFGWRAVVRELIGLVPGGVGLALKAAVAYAGTYTVGRAAEYFYAGNGRKMNRRQLRGAFRSALRDSADKVRGLIARN